MGTIRCSKCSSVLKAEIKNSKVEGAAYKRLTPVWSCSLCAMTSPVKYDERMKWVDQLDWNNKAFLYGFDRTNATRCLGCACERHMHAEVERLLNDTLFLWKIQTVYVPVWSCSVCGYTSMILYKDRYSWTDRYNAWS